MLRLFALVVALCILHLAPAAAQQVGDPIAGFAVASEACAECHDVTPIHGASRDLDPLPFEELEAKPFEEVANTPGVTAMALFAWMQSTHPTMPGIVLKKEELRNVVAYILSLKNE